MLFVAFFFANAVAAGLITKAALSRVRKRPHFCTLSNCEGHIIPCQLSFPRSSRTLKSRMPPSTATPRLSQFSLLDSIFCQQSDGQISKKKTQYRRWYTMQTLEAPVCPALQSRVQELVSSCSPIYALLCLSDGNLRFRYMCTSYSIPILCFPLY